MINMVETNFSFCFFLTQTAILLSSNSLATLCLEKSSDGRNRSLVINDLSEPGSKGKPLLSTSEWTVKDVDSDAIDALQVLVYPYSYSKAIMVNKYFITVDDFSKLFIGWF
jgi:hypothetical protein